LSEISHYSYRDYIKNELLYITKDTKVHIKKNATNEVFYRREASEYKIDKHIFINERIIKQ